MAGPAACIASAASTTATTAAATTTATTTTTTTAKSTKPHKPIAVVTGGNRGIGKAIVKGLAQLDTKATIIFTSRTEESGKKALEAFQKHGISNVECAVLDLDDDDSIKAFTDNTLKKHGRVDWLVNNAGVLLDYNVSILKTEINTLGKTLKANVEGPLKLIQAFTPGMIERNYGRIVNMSSGLGSMTEMSGKSWAYRVSKAAINSITKVLDDELKALNAPGVLVNSVCPGAIKTDMNQAGKGTPEEGADSAIWLVGSDEHGPHGGFFRGRKPIMF